MIAFLHRLNDEIARRKNTSTVFCAHGVIVRARFTTNARHGFG